MSDAAQELRDKVDPDQDVRLALSAVAAIQRLVDQRRELRGLLAAQDRELARLRRSLSNIRETYRKLTCDLVRQMQNIDGIIGDVQGTRDRSSPPPAQSVDTPSLSSEHFDY
jgi:hypothetical protein